MLPDRIKPIGFHTSDTEPWLEYASRLSLPDECPLRQFYRQVVYDHFIQFNDEYPDFNIAERKFETLHMKAIDFAKRVRYFRNEPMDWWHQQYDDFKRKNYDYIIYQEMSRNRTFPFPPIVMEADFLVDIEGRRAYGRPLHLVEGTHRVSYLMRMVELELVKKDSMHEIVLIK